MRLRQIAAKLKNMINKIVKAGDSLQAIADKLNMWRVPTRSGSGKWYSKSVNDLID